MADQDGNVTVREWFWRLMENIGVEKYTDEVFYDEFAPVIIEQILNRIIDRTYLRTGKGGFFPMKKSKKDQRKVELWYQMNEYLVENYYTDYVVV